MSDHDKESGKAMARFYQILKASYSIRTLDLENGQRKESYIILYTLQTFTPLKP